MKSVLANVILVSTCALAPAWADLLTFTGNACSANTNGSGALTACTNGGYVNESYGQTADVTITYKDLITGNSLKSWTTGYSNLSAAVWGGTSDTTGASWNQIDIAPASGYSILLNSFYLGGYNNTAYTTHVRILDLKTSAVLLDYGAPTVGTGGISTLFSPNVASSDGLVIEIKDTGWDVGIDNINFTASYAAPEPSAAFLLLTSVALLAGLVYRRKSI